MRRLTIALLASLLLPAVPTWADDIRHGPVVYGTSGAHQHGPVHYGNGPDRREAPGRYRTHPGKAAPERRHDAPPLIIVEPRIDLDDPWRPHDTRPRHPHGPHRIDHDRGGESHGFPERDDDHGRP